MYFSLSSSLPVPSRSHGLPPLFFFRFCCLFDLPLFVESGSFVVWLIRVEEVPWKSPPARLTFSENLPWVWMSSSNDSKGGKCTGDSIGYGRISGSKDNNSNGNGSNASKGSSSSKGNNTKQIGDRIGYGRKKPPPPKK
ncbi:uncharacterized protein LOC129319418 [Prosopis cineraria]|uniref:uncharacterized protein LOC129319418 n=1 Tax=Prosopis cineraria TaxID=364024 RepID=UPI00240F9194|nr:uncharacterized protein LOC129319418 [Prosopis cineraria]